MSKVWRIRSNAYDPANNYSSGRYLELKITETVNEGANTSTLNWELFSKNRSGHYYTVDKTTIVINGTTVYYKDKTPGQSHEFPARAGDGHDYNASGSIVIAHAANGQKRDVPIVFKTSVWYWNGNPRDWATESGHSFVNDVQTDINGAIDLTDIAHYTLTINQGANSTIIVNRTASGAGSIGALSNNAKLYYGDKLQISFSAANNYQINEHTVNDNAFTSGSTYTVSGNTIVKSSATALLTTVTATSADIGGYSTMVFNRHNNAYFHSLQVCLQNEWRFVDSSGQLAQTEERFQREAVNFWVSMSFMFDLPAESSTVNIPIRCYTYSNAEAQSPLGDTTAELIATARDDLLLPIITASVVDTNSATTNLTGDSSLLVRYISNACCEAQIRAFREATIIEAKINDIPVTVSVDGNELYTCTYTFNEVTAQQFVFWAKDSRGKTSTVIITPTIIPYVKPTVYLSYAPGDFNEQGVWVDSPVGTHLKISIHGNYYAGSFGSGEVNRLSARTRSYSYSTDTQDVTHFINNVSATGAYSTDADYSLRYDYQFDHVIATGVEDRLSTASTSATIPAGLPIFDFGKDSDGDNDFNINGSLKIGDTDIFDLIYPIGSVYLHTTNVLPDSIGAINKGRSVWVSITTGISGVYGWKRTG